MELEYRMTGESNKHDILPFFYVSVFHFVYTFSHWWSYGHLDQNYLFIVQIHQLEAFM